MAVVGDLITSAIVKEITSRLFKLLQDEITRQWKFRGELDKIARKMKDLDALMHDADDKVSRGGVAGAEVGRWLIKLKSVSYDIEDMLDDLDTQHKKAKFTQWMSRPPNLDVLKKSIEEIEFQGQKFNLGNGPEVVVSRTAETVSVGGAMQGRDTEKDNLISLLFRGEASDISIIPIVGLGGIGKTTLAQSVLADKRVQSFDIRIWVHVSDLFDLSKIGRAITGGSLDASTSLDSLHESVKVKLTGKKYLIVLDDLWEEDGSTIEKLKQMLQYGSKGSRIIVTTRNQRVVESGLRTGFLANTRKICVVPEADQINLSTLSRDECWELMKIRAFGPDDDQSSLEIIGKEIAGLCGGLPLVANAFGQVMSKDKSSKAWKDIINRMVYLGLGVKDQESTLKSLKLSYYYMEPDYKLCFTYLAAFPKGFVIDTNRLIQQWDALGYTYLGFNGETVLKYLLGMSFVQISGSASVGPSSVHAKPPQEVTMHDFVHELVSLITAEEFHVMDATEPKKWDKYIHCRHAQLLKYTNQSDVFKHLPAKLRTLHFRNSHELQLPEKAFSGSKYIRILDLSASQNNGDSMRLPSSMHKLKLLRYFDATGLPIASLPKSFSKLQNMKTLIMSNCSLKSLPDNIHTLYKLCYLDLSGNRSLEKLPKSLGTLSDLSSLNLLGCYALQELPESICDLACLEILDMSKCGAIEKLPDQFGSLPKLLFLNLSGCSKLKKLPDIVNLEFLEHLNLSSCHELQNLPQEFGKLKNLVFLNLCDCYKVSMLPETFCLLTNLKHLDLSDCHELKELPDHFGDLSKVESFNRFGDLSKLESLNLSSCSKIELLPESLCKMINLRHLDVSYCISLQKLPSSLGNLKLHTLDISCAMALERLPDRIDNMSSLSQIEFLTANNTVWDMAEAIKESLNLPMRTVHIVHQMESRSCSSIVELDKLTCRDLEVVKLQNVRNPEEAERARLREKTDLRLLSLKWGYVEEDIPVIGREAFLSSFIQPDRRPNGDRDKPVLEKLLPPRTLEKFLIQGYLSPDFPSWMSSISSHLPSLTILGICGLGQCHTLPPLGQLPNLRSLYLGDSPKITTIGKEFYGDAGTCAKLRVLDLSSMVNLEEWWTTRSGKEDGQFLIPNLHSLSLKASPKLKFQPYPPKSMHWHLEKNNEVLPEGGFGELQSSVNPYRMVILNCNFTPSKWNGIKHFSTLEILFVDSCVSLRVLPECLWELTSLRELSIILCPHLTSLPEVERIKQLTALKKLHIEACPNLAQRCQGEDAHKISHIQEVTFPEMTTEMLRSMKLLLRQSREPQSTSGEGGASTSRDAGAWTYGDDEASTSGGTGAPALFADLAESLMISRLLREMASISIDTGASTSGEVGASTSRAPKVSASQDAGESTSFAKSLMMARLLTEPASTSREDGPYTSGDAGSLTSGDSGASTSGDVGSSASFASLGKSLMLARLLTEPASTSREAGPSISETAGAQTSGEAEASASVASFLKSLMMARLLTELESMSGDATAWTSANAGASTSGDAGASTSEDAGPSTSCEIQ